MKNNELIEIGIVGVLVALSVTLLNPFHAWMPSMMHMTALAGTLVAFGVLAAFILREQVRDEREVANRSFSGRIGFLAGAGVLLAAIVYQQGVQDMLDPWLIYAFMAMVVTKGTVRIYSDRVL